MRTGGWIFVSPFPRLEFPYGFFPLKTHCVYYYYTLILLSRTLGTCCQAESQDGNILIFLKHITEPQARTFPYQLTATPPLVSLVLVVFIVLFCSFPFAESVCSMWHPRCVFSPLVCTVSSRSFVLRLKI